MKGKKYINFISFLILFIFIFLFFSCSTKNYTIRNDIKKRINYYIEEGVKQFKKGDLNKSYTDLIDALNLSISIGDVRSEFIILTKILMIFIFKEDEVNCNIYIGKLNDIIKFEKDKLTNDEYYIYYYVIGDFHFYKREYENSLSSYNKALNYTKDNLNISFIYIKISKAYIEMIKYDEALIFLNKANHIGNKLKNYDILGDVYYNFAKIYFLKNKYNDALMYIKKALEFDNITENVVGIFFDYLLISEIYEKLNNFEIQKYYLIKALNLSIFLNIEKYTNLIYAKLEKIKNI